MHDKKGSLLNKLPDEKRQKILSMSEPELLIEYMDKHKDWAVIVCLVGGGQDINTGEAGIQEWFDSLRRSYPDWKVYISNKITEEEYIGNSSFDRLIKKLDCTIVDEVHLSISLRLFRTEKIVNFGHYLVNNEQDKAAELYKEIKKVYQIYDKRLGYSKTMDKKANYKEKLSIWSHCKLTSEASTCRRNLG